MTRSRALPSLEVGKTSLGLSLSNAQTQRISQLPEKERLSSKTPRIPSMLAYALP
jgi:hypothetical protein